MKSLLTSRKFWSTIAGIATAVAFKMDGEVTATTTLQAIIAAIAALVLGIAHEDAHKVILTGTPANDIGEK